MATNTSTQDTMETVGEVEKELFYLSKEMEFLKIFMTLTEKERVLIGHDFKSFIKSCTFKGENCLDKRKV